MAEKQEPTVCWRGGGGDASPVRCECEVFGYPNYCTSPDGKEQMYSNRHFLEIEDAWQSIYNNAVAGVRLAGSAVVSARARVLEVNERAADASLHFDAVMDGYQEFLGDREGTSCPTYQAKESRDVE